MKLDMEELDDFFRLFKDKEHETPVFVGQVNYQSETSMSVDVSITTRYVDDGEVTIVSYKESCGVAEIPEQVLDRPETKDLFEAQKKELDNLDILAEAKKKEMEDIFTKKGYITFRGVWTDGSHL